MPDLKYLLNLLGDDEVDWEPPVAGEIQTEEKPPIVRPEAPDGDSLKGASHQVAIHLRKAGQELRQALRLCAQVEKSRDASLIEKRRARGVAQRARRAMNTLGNGTSRVSPGWDLNDPDLMPEDEKMPRSRMA